jgi:hypothetical protein
MNGAESISVRVMPRTEGISVRVMIRIECISVRVMIRTENISVRLIRMLPQLVGLFPVGRVCVKLDVFFQILVRFVM